MTKFIIVDSVKGGCGKTTESLAAAIRCARKKEKEHSVCVIDMDLLGTSMEYMLFNEGFIKSKPEASVNVIDPIANLYLNDVAKGEKGEYKSGIKIILPDRKLYVIDFIISSPNERDKGNFRISGDSNYSLNITPTHFRGTIKKIIEELIENDYDTVIFDMPPNSDAYTDCVFDLLLDSSYRNRADKIESVELIIVSTYDRAHIYANKEWLISICEGQDHRRKQFDKITFLLNNNCVSGNACIVQNTNIKTNISEALPKSLYSQSVKYAFRSYSTALLQHFLFNSKKFTDFSDVRDAWYLFDIIEDNPIDEEKDYFVDVESKGAKTSSEEVKDE